MPKVHYVKSARKDNARCAVLKGQSYYWWKNRGAGGKGAGFVRCSRNYPRPSMLTMSPYFTAVYALQEQMADHGAPEDGADLESLRDEWAAEARSIGEEQQEKFDNMPEGLQQGDTGQMLECRANACESWADEIENVEIPDREDFPEGEDGDEEYTEAVSTAYDEIVSLIPEDC